MKAALLSDRGIIKVSGEPARGFLNGLVTSDIGEIAAGTARYAALLTPQGKIIADFIVTEAPAEDGGGFFLDCPRALLPNPARPAQLLQAARQDHDRGFLGRPRRAWRSGTAAARPRTASSIPIRACPRSACA